MLWWEWYKQTPHGSQHTSILPITILPCSTLLSTVTRKFMSTLYHGTSGPSGSAGSGPTPAQPVSGNYPTTEPMLIRLEQLLQERLMSNQIKKLTVRSLVNMFGLRTNGLSADIRNLLKCSWNSSTRYNPPSDRVSVWLVNRSCLWQRKRSTRCWSTSRGWA